MWRTSLAWAEHLQSISCTGRVSPAWAEPPGTSTGHAAWCASSRTSCAEGAERPWGPPGHFVSSCWAAMCPWSCSRGVPSPSVPSPTTSTHQPEVFGAGARGSAGSVLWPLLHGAEGSPGRCRAVRQWVAAGGDRACRGGQGDSGKATLPGATSATGHARHSHPGEGGTGVAQGWGPPART